MNYKAPDNSLHFIEPEFAHLLPAGSVPITEDEAEIIRIAAIVPPTYSQLRAAAYPAIGDQLDAIWKGGEAEVEMLTQILAVKTRYPKP